ncbi:MAG: ABC transporter permease [Zetaproteobacteria bacterium]|nr:MAG: ABC transporter permease [Zetaproteobacteria bacterium]
MRPLSLAGMRRLLAMIAKEFIQMRRDRLTFAMMLGIPVIQLTLFGFAINTDPKHLSTAIVIHEPSAWSRTILDAVARTGYFDFLDKPVSHEQADLLLRRGEVQFVIEFPDQFSKKLVRGEHPSLLVIADATDPVTIGNALTSLAAMPKQLTGRLPGRADAPFSIIIHRRYNPEGITQYNIVPALMGVILTMTMVLVTSVAITREHERGTMEYLLVTPVRPIEVMVGKLVPYILVGYLQVALVLLAAIFLFHVPIRGSVGLVLLLMLPFIAANLAMGITFSTMARNQMQAMQMSFFFFLPSILLSGFMFPFRGMPDWAQWLGEGLPLTHFLRIVRGVLLKQAQASEVLVELWPILIFFLLAMAVAVIRYRRTLD